MDGQSARVFLADLRQRKRELAEELAKIEGLENGIASYLGMAIVVDQVGGSIPPVRDEHRRIPPSYREVAASPPFSDKSITGKTWKGIVAGVLYEVDRPLTLLEIRKAIQDHQLDGGASKSSMYNTIYTVLNRNPDAFEKVDKNHWALKSSPGQVSMTDFFDEET